MKTVHALYFSATLTTAKVVEAIAKSVAASLNAPLVTHNITTPESRLSTLAFCDNDIVIFGVPVYIGRVPNLIKPWLETIRGNGALGVPVVVYGNRNYDDALVELYDMMAECGFMNIAAAAFVGEHSFSQFLGAKRPDDDDIRKAEDFGKAVAQDLSPKQLNIPGNRPYRFFKAVDEDGKPFDIRKVKPVTDNTQCTKCGICASLCPMGAISKEDYSNVEGICIKCGACVKRCPNNAKSFTDSEYLRHLAILEKNFGGIRREPDVFGIC